MSQTSDLTQKLEIVLAQYRAGVDRLRDIDREVCQLSRELVAKLSTAHVEVKFLG